MRVLVMAEQLRRAVPGGIGTYVEGLATGLAGLADRPEIALLASRGPDPDPLERFGLPVLRLPLPGPLQQRAWDAGLAPLRARCDLVHATSLAIPRTAGAIPRTAGGIPPADGPAVLATVHDLAWRRLPCAFPARGRRWHEAALARALRRCRGFVVPSTATAEALVGAGAPEGAVEVIEEGADHLPEPDHAGAAALLDRLGVTGRFAACVGTREPRKNLPRLLAAWSRARPRLPPGWQLVVVGPPGWGPGPVPGDGVAMAGRVSPAVLAALYVRAALVAYVPLLEGFGLPAVEAMRAGAPVVASPMPSTGGAALEVDPTDEAAIAEGLVSAATDEPLRARLVASGSARAAGLTWDATAAAHVALWHRTLAER
ncbi:MAG: glycosyltransferase family 4 protein [Acidimicrobiales bacterium]